jgi:hypothetical protein
MLGNVPLIEGRFHVNRTNCLVHTSIRSWSVQNLYSWKYAGLCIFAELKSYICSDGALHDYLSAAGSNLEGGESVYQGPVGGVKRGREGWRGEIRLRMPIKAIKTDRRLYMCSNKWMTRGFFIS